MRQGWTAASTGTLGAAPRGPGRRIRLLGAIALGVLAALACTAGTASAKTAKPQKTVWLCKPGEHEDPCKERRTATVVKYTGETREQTIEKQRRSSRAIDCFYVYPTVSEQETENANLEKEPQEKQIAIDQASRFSQECKVFAPMYPQLTLDAINNPEGVKPEAEAKAYYGVLTAFLEYLKKYNKGRGFVLIGHSQGSLMLEQLIKEQIDPNPALRKQLVSAILLGGNVLVPEGQLVGGTFQNVPACTAAPETHCVVAYSSFYKEPPEGAYFGRDDSPLTGQGPEGDEVLCVNPTLEVQDGSVGELKPYESHTTFPGVLGYYSPAPTWASTPWVASPEFLDAQCKKENGASWLNISFQKEESAKVREEREELHEVPEESLGPDWGLHLYDVNIALGNLVPMVAQEAQTYQAEG